MASYTVDFSAYDHNPALKRAKALEEIEKYLGGKSRMKKMGNQSVHDNIPRRAFIAGLELFVGIAGFPAQAWADSLGLVDEPVTEQQALINAMSDYYIMVELAIEKDLDESNDERIDTKFLDKGTVLDWLATEDDILEEVANRVKAAILDYRAANPRSNQGDSAS